MKTIKIFLASSEELDYDRMVFGNLVRRLDDIYEKNGVRIKLFEWEDYDAAYNDRRKQDEYNEYVRKSDIFIGLFHKKAGKFTIEEFDIASEEFKKHASPKVYTYCKDLMPGEQEDPELTEFKKRLFDEMGHYWSRYSNRDSLQFHFVMQLQLVETSNKDNLKVIEGTIVLNGIPIAQMDRLQFVAGNEAYQKMNNELMHLPDKIEKARALTEKYPDDDDLKEELQQRINRFNQLKEDFDQLQNALFETAQRITAMQLEYISEKLQRAIEAFDNGNLERANTLLDEIAIEAERHVKQLDMDRSLVHRDISALQLQAKTVMADAGMPIQDRIEKTLSIYKKTDEWAEKSALDKEKYIALLYDFADFLRVYGKYEESEKIYLRCISIAESIWGEDHKNTSSFYERTSSLFMDKGDYSKALTYATKALNIRIQIYGENHLKTSFIYDILGLIYNSMNEPEKALEYCTKALHIREKEYSEGDFGFGVSYCNLGLINRNAHNFTTSLEYYNKAKTIFEKNLKSDDYKLATLYDNIGFVYNHLGKDDKAIPYWEKALNIRKKVLGYYHPNTAVSYDRMAAIFRNKENYPEAHKCYKISLDIKKKCYGEKHLITAQAYSNLGLTFIDNQEYDKALQYLFKAEEIETCLNEKENETTASTLNNIGAVYYKKDCYEKAIDYYRRALEIKIKCSGNNNHTTAITMDNIGMLYRKINDYEHALEYSKRALEIAEECLGPKHHLTSSIISNIGLIYKSMGDPQNALVYFRKAYEYNKETLGIEHPITQKSLKRLEENIIIE